LEVVSSPVYHLGFKFFSHFVQVDLLLAELQGFAASAKGNGLHAQHALVKGAGALDILHGQHQMIKAINVHNGIACPPACKDSSYPLG
jgi:hypothetical protein